MTKRIRRFFASFLCVCMIITSCPDILAWAAGDTAVIKPTKYRLTAETLSKMVKKADRDKTEDNGLCKLKLPRGYGAKSPRMQVYLQPDEENLIFLFVNTSKKKKAAALIVDNKMSDIIAVSTLQDILDEDYATDSDSNYDTDTDGVLDADFMDMAAEILDGTTTESDNDADEKFDHLDGDAFDVVLNDGTAGAALVVSLWDLGLDDMGELLPADEDEENEVVIASDSNAETNVPADNTPVILPSVDPVPVVVEPATPSNTNVSVATPSNVAKTFIKELNGVKIRAHAEAGVIPDEATFEAIELKETGDTADAYKEACQKLDEDEDTQYDGVMAYDLHFLLDGEEIEPDGEVQITMEVSEKALPENADPTSIEVKHCDETGSEAEVKTVADIGDKAEGTVEVSESVMASSEKSEVAEMKKKNSNATAVEMKFTVDSFSYFYITYNHNNTNPELIMYLRDIDGKDVSDKLNGYGTFPKYDPANLNTGNSGSTGSSTPRVNCWISIEATAGTFGQYTQGYTYLGAFRTFKQETVTEGENTTTTTTYSDPIKWFYYKEVSGRNADTSKNGYYWSSEDDRPTKDPTDSSISDKSKYGQFGFVESDTDTDGQNKISVTRYGNVYLKYAPNKDIASEIKTEDIETDGWLSYKYIPEEGIEDDVEYKWFRGTVNDKDEFVLEGEVEPKTVTGTTRNIVQTEDGTTHLYPGLDLDENNVNTRRWYQVKVYRIGETDPIYTTKPVQVPYYAALQNGGFEYPEIKDLHPNGYMSVPIGTTGLEWKPTGTDQLVELINIADSPTAYKLNKMAEGKQCAELNAEAEGSLYQTVLTTPGTTLHWKLSHHARSYAPHKGDIDSPNPDVMFLIIAPTKEAKNLTTQKAIKDKIESDTKQAALSENGIYEKDGFLYQKVTTRLGEDWHNVTGTYTVPSGQYLTNFFFVAYSTASGDTTVGNLLDDVGFSTELEPAAPGTANIEVKKIVQGVRPEDMDKYHIELRLEKLNGKDWKLEKTAILDFTKDDYTATHSFTVSDFDLDSGTQYRVIETPKFDKGISMTYTQPTRTITFKDGNNAEKTIDEETGFKVENEHSYRVTFTNKYDVSLTVKKIVKGNMANPNDMFDFTVAVNGTSANINGVYSVKKEGSDETTQRNVDAGKFYLKHGESIIFDDIPYGAKVTITEGTAENGYKDLGYTTSYTDNDGKSQDNWICGIDTMTGNHIVTFTNTHGLVIPTGIFNDGKPTGWLFLIAAAAGCFTFGLYRRRKKKLNNGEECL